MKPILLAILSLLLACTGSAQLTITRGAAFTMNGNLQLTLKNIDLLNHGSFIAGNSMVSFTGNISSTIAGDEAVQFNELEINKSANSLVALHREIGVGQRILFSSGFLNLNGFNADLGLTGHLDGEQENTRIIGPNGGVVQFTGTLNSPTGSNLANLGIFITSTQDLGIVTIKRGHQSQINGAGLGNSIFRFYDIIPANNTNLNATLRFRYHDAELNSLDENSIVFFKSQNTSNWINLGINSRDVVANFAEKSGISSFERFTLSTIGNALPVRFILFNAYCENNRVLLTWKTAQELNSSHFIMERSIDGINWTPIGAIPAAGTSMTEKAYSFRDNYPLQNSLYRIAQYDLDGRMQYTGTIRSSCTTTDIFGVWPNPVHDILSINIVAAGASKAMIRVFDSKGALVKMQSVTISQGNNQLSINMESLANAVYSVTAVWNNGKNRKTVQVLKQ